MDTVSLIQSVIKDQLGGFKTTELGLITQVYSHESNSDKNNYDCDVRLRDSGLELKRVPVSTQRIGAVAIPNIDDLVLVQFINGDIHSALITSRLYNDQDRPPEAKPHEFVYISPDTAESGTRRIYLEVPNGNTFLLDDEKLILEMGETKPIMNNNGTVEIKSNDQNITMTDQVGNKLLNTKVKQEQITKQGQTKGTFESPKIDLVENISHLQVYGDQFLQYRNQHVQLYHTHIHQGDVTGVIPVVPAPQLPPFPLPTPSMLSTKVKTN